MIETNTKKSWRHPIYVEIYRIRESKLQLSNGDVAVKRHTTRVLKLQRNWDFESDHRFKEIWLLKRDEGKITPSVFFLINLRW
jgi:hypothetical protein